MKFLREFYNLSFSSTKGIFLALLFMQVFMKISVYENTVNCKSLYSDKEISNDMTKWRVWGISRKWSEKVCFFSWNVYFRKILKRLFYLKLYLKFLDTVNCYYFAPSGVTLQLSLKHTMLLRDYSKVFVFIRILTC